VVGRMAPQYLRSGRYQRRVYCSGVCHMARN
jgi:hypothetical protein